MIITLFVALIGKFIDLVVDFFPSSDFLPLPAGFYEAMTGLGHYLGIAANIFPDGFFANLLAAATFVLAVRLVVVPILAGQGLTLPFGRFFRR